MNISYLFYNYESLNEINGRCQMILLMTLDDRQTHHGYYLTRLLNIQSFFRHYFI
jgi:hypothetical protein